MQYPAACKNIDGKEVYPVKETALEGIRFWRCIPLRRSLLKV